MKQKIFKTLTLLVYLCTSAKVLADVNKSLERYHLKKTVKSLLEEQVDSIIRTKLAADSYQVDLTLDLNPDNFSKEKDVKIGSEKNLDYRLKLFDMQKIISAYRYKKGKEKDISLPKIKNIKMLIGISENYKGRFRSSFKTWFKAILAERIGDVKISFNTINHPDLPKDESEKNDNSNDEQNKENLDLIKNEIAALRRKIEDEVFGLNKGWIEKISDVKDDIKDDLSKIKGKEEANREIASFDDKSWIDHVKDLQHILGWALFSIFLFLSVRYLSKNLKPQVEVDSNSNLNTTVKEEGVDSEESIDGELIELEKVEEGNSNSSLYDHENEVVNVMLSIPLDQHFKLEVLFDYWMQGDKEGEDSFWYLMSLCVSKSHEKPEFENIIQMFKDFIDKYNIKWTDETKVTFDSVESKKVERHILADLVRLKTFGEKSFKKVLSILKGLDSKEITKLISSIGEADLIFLHLSENQRKEYLRGLDDQKRLELLEGAFGKAKRDFKTLEKIEKSVESWVEVNKSFDDVEQVNLSSKIVNSFSSFSIADKVKYINHIKGEKSSESLYLTHFHPLWMHKLKEKYIREVFESVGYNGLLYLYAINENLREFYIECAAPRVNKMIEEENLEEVIEQIFSGNPKFSDEEQVVIDIVNNYFNKKAIALEDAYELINTENIAA